MTKKILYIDDHLPSLRLVNVMLKMAGYEMLGATSGQSGVDTAAKEHPDLILLDMNLPDIDGMETVKRLKTAPSCSRIPVVALTARVMDGDRERIIEGGCDDYIPKPVMKQELLNTLARYLPVSAC